MYIYNHNDDVEDVLIIGGDANNIEAIFGSTAIINGGDASGIKK